MLLFYVYLIINLHLISIEEGIVMKLFVTATIYSKEEKEKPRHHIRAYSQFNIDCLICYYATGTAGEKGVFGTFSLCLNGKKEDVNEYIAYLENEGFDVAHKNSKK